MSFYDELEREFKNAGLVGKKVSVPDELKPSDKDFMELDNRIAIKTEENRNMLYKSGIYAQNGMPCGSGNIKNISFSNVAFQPVKLRHVSDQNIARCNKNIEPIIKENKKVLQKSLEGANEHKIGIY